MRPTFPKRVRLVEVGPRDGLQNQARRLSVTQKVELIERLAQAGLDYLEAGSFVHPRWVPQMADSDQVLRSLYRQPGVTYAALVPNLKGRSEEYTSELQSRPHLVCRLLLEKKKSGTGLSGWRGV